MRYPLVIIATLLTASGPGSAVRAGERSTTQFVQALLDQGIPPGRILGPDQDGIPRVCGTTRESARPSPAELSTRGNELPPETRAWECIPGVIRDDGLEIFRLEVDVNSDVTRVTLETVSGFLVPPESPPFDLRDDGLGDDLIAGDAVFTAGPFRYDTSAAMPEFYLNDADSPAGLFSTKVGVLTIEELDGTVANFLIGPEIGVLRSDIPDTCSAALSPNITVSPHLINIRSSARETQRFLRFLGGDLRRLTNRIYDALPDAIDFCLFLSTNKIERLPRTSTPNFNAGVHSQVRTNFTGTGLTVFDDTASYGSSGVLLSVNVLDAYTRGLVGKNATHELTHHWSSFTNISLGLSDGTGHYNPRSSAASLVGGFEWNANGDGTFMLNCNEGRNGAFHAPPIDRYMMGLIDGSAVQPLHINSEINFATDCDQVVEPVLTVEMEDIQNMHGVRSPGPSNAKRSFSIAFVVESHARLLNETELTYYERLAEHYAKPPGPNTPTPYVGNNWPSITRYFGEPTTWSTAIGLVDPSFPAGSADFDNNCMTNLTDYAAFSKCLAGADVPVDPTPPFTPQQCLDAFDFDDDLDVDLDDFGGLQSAFSAP